MFREVPRNFNFTQEEERILAFWDERKIYQRSLEQRRNGPPFVFYEGPPTANGLPHPGHCLTRAIKDLFPRYRTMCGHYCERKAGWDTHGLPVEVEVCKELGIHSKEEIEKFGVEPFIHRCLESVFRYTREWEQVTRRLGFWVDLDEAYVTYHQSYVESVWWALKQLYDADLLYQGHKIVWWWAQGGTALSSGEVGQGYREVDDPSVFVRFPIVSDERAQARQIPDKTSLLVWTTTPWTLPSNTFAAVHNDFEYAVVRDHETGERLILAAALVDAMAAKCKAQSWSVERTLSGSQLVGLRYVPPFPEVFYDCTPGDEYAAALSYLPADGALPRPNRRRWGSATAQLAGQPRQDYVAWRVLAADFVTLDAGTGLVHEAPAFGEVDFELMQQERARFIDPNSVPLLCAVAPDGRFTRDLPEKYAGRWVKECDRDLIRDLRDHGLLLHHEQYRHDYPFCWRAEEDPLIQYPRKSWFIRTTRFVDKMLANNRQIRWLPEHIRDGRFGKFLESNVDWALSRERYWGTPLPIWVCEKTGHREAIGSYAELVAKPDVQGTDVWERAKQANPKLCNDLKVHKPYIDAVSYQSPRDPSARMRRIPEVIDCWFDSGAMPFAQWGYPHSAGSIERFASQFPADFISEALDQTRGWFYSLLAISTLLFGPEGAAKSAPAGGSTPTSDWPQPFRNCIVLGLLLGEDGLKMSKSKKNYKEPSYIFDHEGADAMRWQLFSGQPPWTSIRFQEAAIAEAQREFLIRLLNVYSFFVIYANIDGWNPPATTKGLRGALPPAATELDRWILSELHSTVRAVRSAMDAFDNFTATRALGDFVDALSNWYVRRGRDRYWKSGMDADKQAAYATLYDCLTTSALLIAPFTPFFAEAMYRNLVGSRSDAASFPESVHLCDYPQVAESLIDARLSGEMAVVRDIVSLGRAARAEAKLRVRQPLSLVEIVLADRAHTEWLSAHAPLICDELNVKQVEFTAEADHYVQYQVKPNFRAIGPKFGKIGPAIKTALAAVADPAAMRRQLDTTGRASLNLQGETIELTPEDVQIELHARPGWAAAQGRTAVVVLKTELTDELKREGLVRELVHHVQQIRKELDLAYTQRIELLIAGDSELMQVAKQFEALVCGETLASRIMIGGKAGPDGRKVDIEGRAVDIAVKRI